jgi:hypothetical protein
VTARAGLPVAGPPAGCADSPPLPLGHAARPHL